MIQAQSGPQLEFLASPADIAIYGGAAGAGKSYALLLCPIPYLSVSGFNAAIFRRNTGDLLKGGGLWDESHGLYPQLGGMSRETPQIEWRFPSGSVVQFAHLDDERTKFKWQGSQVCMIGFDELAGEAGFTESQFWYMLSRNRSTCGVKPRVRATTNPEADSWVSRLIEWWIDQDTGYAIPERGARVRFFIRDGDELVWGNTPDDLADYRLESGLPIPPTSLTFIPASWRDNRIMLESDPGYETRLSVLPSVERAQLRDGNWMVRPAAGDYFKREWVSEKLVDRAPDGLRLVRGWDLAATRPRPGTDPDWTCGTKMGVDKEGAFFVVDHVYDRGDAAWVENFVRGVAERDGHSCEVAMPEDPGQAGKGQTLAYTRKLAGFSVRFWPVSGDKVTRFKPFSAQVGNGNVYVVRGDWNERWFRELENFPPPKRQGHDDDADSTATAFSALARRSAKVSQGTYSYL